MKKYFLTLIPFFIGLFLSLVGVCYLRQDDPAAINPYRMPEVLDYLIGRWFLIGLITSGIFIAVFLIDDIFSYISKKLVRRNIEKKSICEALKRRKRNT